MGLWVQFEMASQRKSITELTARTRAVGQVAVRDKVE